MVKQIDPRPEIPEEVIADEAQRNRDLCIELGLIFQNAQQEAYEQWCALDEAMDTQKEPYLQEVQGEKATRPSILDAIEEKLRKLKSLLPRPRVFVPVASFAVLVIAVVSYVSVNRTISDQHQQLLHPLITDRGAVDAVALYLRRVWYTDVLGASPELGKEPIYQQAKPATVLVVQDGTGTPYVGVVVGRQGQVLTSYKAVEGARRVFITFDPALVDRDIPRRAFAAQILTVNENAGLALLQMLAPPTDLDVVPLGNPKTVEENETLYALEYLGGGKWNYSSAPITAVKESGTWVGLDGQSHQQTIIQNESEPDNTSGGLLLDAQGKFIGLIVPREVDTSVRSVVAIEVIQNFLQQPIKASAPTESSRASYSTKRYGQDIVAVYEGEIQPAPPDAWLVYMEPGRQLVYAAIAHMEGKKISEVALPEADGPGLTVYFDTNCNGLVDMVGHAAVMGGAIERLELRQEAPQEQSLTLASLTPVLVKAVDTGLIPFRTLFCTEAGG